MSLIAISLGSYLKDQIEWRLGRATEMREPPTGDHFAQTFLAGLRPERRAHFLRYRRRRAQQRGSSVESAADGIQVVFERVASERFHNHPGPITLERTADMFRGTRRIAHVVEAIEKGYKVVVGAGILLGFGNFEPDA